MANTLFEALGSSAQSLPEHEAVSFPMQPARMNFAQLHRASTAFAMSLLQLGLRPGDHIALLAENRLEWVITQAAASAMGAVLVPINTHFAKDDLRFVLLQSDAKAIVLSERFRNNRYLELLHSMRSELLCLQHVIVIPNGGDTVNTFDSAYSFESRLQAGLETPVDLPQVDATAPGALLYTSGTTGFPKGALLSHAGMVHNARATNARLRMTSADRWTSIISLFHCAGCIMNLTGTVVAGACYVGVEAFEAKQMCKIIEAERCTVLSGVPTSYVAMLDHPERNTFDMTSLRAGTCGGADADPAQLRRCVEHFPIPQLVQVYGQTESSTLVSCSSVDDEDRLDNAGLALDGFEVRIVSTETQEVMSAGALGEIHARGPGVMLGYYKRPAETRATRTEDGWLKTGDLGFLDARGALTIAGGRLRDMVIRAGENIYPVEVENFLRAHDAVSDCAVVGLSDAYYGEILGAVVTCETSVSLSDLQHYCQGRLARFKVPEQWFVIDALPLTPSGKVKKTVLREWINEGRLEALV